MPVAVSYNWTGFYVGGEVGGGWANNQVTVIDGSAPFPAGFTLNKNHLSGVLGGVNAGYNYQFERFVVGIDAEFLGSSLRGSQSTTGPTGFTSSSEAKVDWVTTLTARAGYAVNNWLIYAKGGAAWARFKSDGTVASPAGVAVVASSSATNRAGWLIGGGVEWAFARNWSAKFEVDYADFGNKSYNGTDTTIATGAVTTPVRSAKSSLTMAKVGVSYLFR